MMASVKTETIAGNDQKSMPESAIGDSSVQPGSSALESTIDSMIKTANHGTSGGLCPDPRHYHSFRSIPFIMLPLYTCAGCGERLQPYVVGGTSSSSRTAVQCIACGVYAHRYCAFHTEWKTKCASVTQPEVCENTNDASSKPICDEECNRSTKASGVLEANAENPKESFDTDEGTESVEPSVENSDIPNLSRQDALKSIFRRENTGVKASVDATDLPIISTSVSVDNLIPKRSIQSDVQNTKANFPFLSSVRLLPSRITTTSATNSTATIQKCQTWDGVIESSCHNVEKQGNYSEGEVSTEPEAENSIDDTDEGIDPNTTAPLHFASHGFRVVSQALQENIIENFMRLIPKEDSKAKPDPNDQDLPDLGGDDNSSPIVDTESSEHEQSTNGNNGDENDNLEARGLLETSEPQKDSIVDRKRIGLATVAGTIVGGVVGVGLAGPVGGVIGVKCGQTAGMLGLLLEGSVTASVLASGIGVGIAAGQHIQEKHETRVLAIGEGTKQRALLMVRPSIQAPEPIWDELYQQARRSYSGNNTGIVKMLIPNESRAAKRERYEREVDIVETDEDELAITDKVLLLASRILSNKDSLPGHVYRQLIEAFRRRSRRSIDRDSQLHNQKQQICDSTAGVPSSENNFISDSSKDEDLGEDAWLSSDYQRRRDAHAVIKYVTTSLLLTRPGFGDSPSLTEKTATAVESLVFGEIYDLVMEEIEMECQDKDDILLDKIANFERKQNQREESSVDKPCFNYKACISETALEALHCLPQAHSAVDKLRYCVAFLERISEKFSNSTTKSVMGADSLLKMVCQHILLAKVVGINSQISFLEEFARDEQLLRGREGYALVTLQASLHFLNASSDFESDIFGHDED